MPDRAASSSARAAAVPTPLPVTKLNILAYLLSCFCSIAFLVFLNATQSFVITVVLRLKDNIGDYVGTLGFVDELVSVVMCPLWGTLSDKIGTRTVASTAYMLVGVGLISFVQAKSVYPGLLLLRMFFAVGGSGTAAMVTALLSEVSTFQFKPRYSFASAPADDVELLNADPGSTEWYEQQRRRELRRKPAVRNGTLSGLVGLCTGLGAVMAVTVFLPIPTHLENKYDMSPEASLRGAFYLVGVLAILVGGVLYVGLRHDQSRSLTKWIRSMKYHRRRRDILRDQAAETVRDNNYSNTDGSSSDAGFQQRYESLAEEGNEFDSLYLEEKSSYFRLLIKGFTAASEPDIFLAYVGGLIARAASVAVSLFIPLSINQWFYAEGICNITADVKHSCRDAYILSAMLTGVSETCALVSAPIWGILCDRIGKTKSLAISSVIGTVGFFGFAFVGNPQQGVTFFWAVLIGISQIGAIVCSLSLCTERRTEYSGSIAGVYSVTGAAGILILTKLGGWTSDRLRGAPFILMAVFNILLFICSVWVMHHDGIFGDIRLMGADLLSTRARREREALGNRIAYENGLFSHEDSDDDGAE